MNMVSAIKADRQIAGTAAVEMRGITKIFGPRPEEALELLRQGRSKAEVQAENCRPCVATCRFSFSANRRSSKRR